MDAHQWGKFKSWINSDAFPTSRLKLVETSFAFSRRKLVPCFQFVKQRGSSGAAKNQGKFGPGSLRKQTQTSIVFTALLY